MTGHSFWPLLCLAEVILLLGLPSLAFSLIARSWSSESYIFITVYLFLDRKVSSNKAQGPTHALGPSSLTHSLQIYCIGLIGSRSPILWVWATNQDPTACNIYKINICDYIQNPLFGVYIFISYHTAYERNEWNKLLNILLLLSSGSAN